ncbi:MAG: cyclic nucleotide-binding domain-containing protein, partial [Pseudomonadota bacterium]
MADDVTQASDKAQPPPWAAGTDDRMHELDPALTEDEIALVRRYGEETTYKAGTWLWRTGERAVGLFLVLDGELDVVAQRDGAEQHIITHSAGHYAGETTSMIARGALVDGRAKTDLHVLEVSSQRLREMIALEAELGEKIFLSFILRRMRLIAEDQGDITLYGVAEEAETARVRTFLSRQGIPFAFRDLGDDGNQSRLDALGHAPQDRPVVSSDRLTLVKPSIRALAEELGIAATIKPDQTYDLVVAGGGPGGLAAAVYGASEGLSVLVVESLAPGGQAATSSRIENFFGFPTGISGQALTGRGFLQASKFGAEVASA